MTKADKIRDARKSFVAMDPILKIKLYNVIMEYTDDKTLAKICRVIVDHTGKKA